jgi:hypothetical protein
MSRAFARYIELLDQLLWRRAVQGNLSDDDEERFATSLNDCRSGMSPDEEIQIDVLIADRKAAAAKPPLDLVDVAPSPTTDWPLRRSAA